MEIFGIPLAAIYAGSAAIAAIVFVLAMVVSRRRSALRAAG